MQGKINVSVENIFPLIKRFLYSDHEIFLRELISNATDASLKLKHLAGIGEAEVDYTDPRIDVKLDKEQKTLTISDNGIGMTAEEVEKYINQVAFSGAEEFLEKYKDSAKDSGIIGHFGLGFYSAFMVAERVEIITKSYKDSPAVHWSCDGSPNFTLEETDEKSNHGTDIVLHIAEDSTEFLEEGRIRELLRKYNRFMPVPIQMGTKTESLNLPEDAPEDAVAETIEVPNIINNPTPAWTKMPSQLTDEDYKAFYHELYPMQFDEPLFHIHLNVDYPFNLTGILFFPKLGNNINIEKDKIQLYQNQVFVTDEVQGIVPDFLLLLRGVIDSPDIPLNVSRSYLQADGEVKKISNYITKKVGDRLTSLMKEDREAFEQKWKDIKVVIEYGMVTDDKFYERAKSFSLFPTVSGKNYLWDELLEEVQKNQVDKEGNTIILYTTDAAAQDTYIQSAEAKGYSVVVLDSPLTPHLIQKLEEKNEKVRFARVDADHINQLIAKEENSVSLLNEEEKEELKKIAESVATEQNYQVKIEDLSSEDLPVSLTQPEFFRRMKDMQQLGGGMMGMGMPEMYQLVINSNSSWTKKLLSEENEEAKKTMMEKAVQLAKLSQGLLKGKDLTSFIKSSF